MGTIVFFAAVHEAEQTALVRALADRAASRDDCSPLALFGGPAPAGGVEPAWHWHPFVPATAIADIDAARDAGHRLLLVDLPAGVNGKAAPVLRGADLIVLPVRPDPDTIGGVGLALNGLTKVETPFLFVVCGADLESPATSAAVMTLAQHGTICPVILPRSSRGSSVPASDSPIIGDVLDYLLARLSHTPLSLATIAAAESPATVSPAPTPAKSEKKRKASIKTASPKERQAPAGTPSPKERRQFPRWDCDVPAILNYDGERLLCRIVDISGGGMAVELDRHLETGKQVVVEANVLGTVTAVIRHSTGNHIGLMFAMEASDQAELVFRMVDAIQATTLRSSHG